MNKQFYRSIIISFLLTGFGIWCLMKVGVGDQFSMRNIYDVAPETEDSIVCLYKEFSGREGQATWFLTRTNKDAKVILSRSLEIDTDKTQCLQCITDEKGYTYVLMEEVCAHDSELPSKQYVTVYDREFNNVKNIFVTQPDPVAVKAAKGDLQYGPKMRWKMQSLQHINGDVLAVQVKDTQTIVLHIYNSLTDTESVYTYNFPDVIRPEEVITDGRGGLYMTDLHSRLFHVLADGAVHQITFNDFKIPSRISIDSQNGILYFTDAHNFTFVRYVEDKQQAEIMYRTTDNIGANLKFENIRGLHYDNGSFIAFSEPKYRESGNRFFYRTNRTGETFQFSVEKKPEETGYFEVIKKYGYQVLLIISLVISLLWAKLWARRILLKVLAIVPAVIICISFVCTYTAGNFFYTLCDNFIKQQFYIMAQYVARDIYSKDLQTLQGMNQNIDDPAYKEIMDRLNRANLQGIYDLQKESEQKVSQRIINWFMRSKQNLIYYSVYYVKAGRPYLIEDLSSQYLSNKIGTSMEYLIGVEGYEKFLKDAQSPSDSFTTKKHDMNDMWISSISTIYDGDGTIVGYVELGMSQDNFQSILEDLQRYVGISMGFFTWIFFLTILATTYYTLRPLNVLRRGVEALGAGKLDTVVDIRSRDEFEDIGNAFNKMAWQIKSHMEQITTYSQACARFIPFGFFRLIGKERIEDIVLGDQTVKDVIILSIDTMISSGTKVDCHELLLPINQLFTIMAREIDKTGGMIESYFNTGLRAIYPGDADEALDAALRILDAIDVYNRQNDLDKIFVQVALTSGNTMIGIIGSHERMETVLMAENVDQAVCLQKIANAYRVHMLITESVCQKITQPSLYALREVGHMRNFVENGFAIKFLNCLNAEPIELRKVRLQTQPLFEEGVVAYEAGDYARARKLFVDVVRVDGADELAKAYVFLCDHKQHLESAKR